MAERTASAKTVSQSVKVIAEHSTYPKNLFSKDLFSPSSVLTNSLSLYEISPRRSLFVPTKILATFLGAASFNSFNHALHAFSSDFGSSIAKQTIMTSAPR